MPDLFTPLQLGPYTIPNRVFLAPLTRCRAGPGNVPHALNAEYYAQRATGGLLISEATQVSPQGVGYGGTPGMHTDAQVAGWRLVTDAVHRAGGRIFAQLWHVGRSSHPVYQPDGAMPVSSSAVAKTSPIYLPDRTQAASPVPRALETEEIPLVIADFRRAAENARQAGFDGVELHGANGYLPDQFLRDGVNRRTDRYGGSIENRARFHLEAMQAMIEVWGPSRVGVRLSPSGFFNDMRDSSPRATFGYLITQLDKLGLAYVHIMEAPDSDVKAGLAGNPAYEAIAASYFRPMFKGPLVVNGGFTFEKAQAYLQNGWADAFAFGTSFLANPDLPERFRRMSAGRADVPLNPPDPATFYSPGPKGYVDYPTLASV